MLKKINLSNTFCHYTLHFQSSDYLRQYANNSYIEIPRAGMKTNNKNVTSIDDVLHSIFNILDSPQPSVEHQPSINHIKLPFALSCTTREVYFCLLFVDSFSRDFFSEKYSQSWILYHLTNHVQDSQILRFLLGCFSKSNTKMIDNLENMQMYQNGRPVLKNG